MGKRIVIVLLLAGILGGMLALPAGAVDLQLAAPSAVLMDLATGTAGASQRHQGDDSASHYGGGGFRENLLAGYRNCL